LVRPKAPPIGGNRWLNCEPIPFRDLRGRAVVVLFWAASCQASWVRLRELETLHRRLGARAAVIAVHSPRFVHEIDEAVVKSALTRNRVSVPVLHDPELLNWANYGLEGRPTAVVIDHRGRVIGAVSGLDDLSLVDEAAELADLVAVDARERSGKTAVALPALTTTTPWLPRLDRLAWPSGIAALPDGLVVVVDSGNHRLLTLALAPGRASAKVVGELGDMAGARMVCAIDEDTVAITFPDSGRVERVDLTTGDRQVLVDKLVRPQGLLLDKDGALVVADAGADQLIRVLPDGHWGAVAGTGFTGIKDGRAGRADLAQPMGVTRTDRGILFTEAGSSALRLLTDERTSGARVFTVTARDPSWEKFAEPGLVDGPAHGARLENPGGAATLDDGSIVVADTGNNRLRLLTERKMRTVPLSGLITPEDVETVGPNHVLVADTGNHRLVVVDLLGQDSWPLDLTGLLPEDPEMPTPVGQGLNAAAIPATNEKPSALHGVVGGTVVFHYPTPGESPWTISVSSHPTWLLPRPITVSRSQPDEAIVVSLSGAGEGELVLRVSGANAAGPEVVRLPITVITD